MTEREPRARKFVSLMETLMSCSFIGVLAAFWFSYLHSALVDATGTACAQLLIVSFPVCTFSWGLLWHSSAVDEAARRRARWYGRLLPLLFVAGSLMTNVVMRDTPEPRQIAGCAIALSVFLSPYWLGRLIGFALNRRGLASGREA